MMFFASLFASWRFCVSLVSDLGRTSLGRMALLGSLLLWASFPPLDFGPLAWIAPIPWVLLIRRERLDARHPYAVLWLAGFIFWMGALHWLRLPHPATSVGWIALSFYFAFYLPVFVGLSRVAVHRLRVPVTLAAPIVWTGLELARGHLLTGMSMACLGHTQYRWIELIQVSDLAGAYAVSFVVMFVAASLARMLPGTGPFFGRKACLADKAPAENMDLSPSGARFWPSCRRSLNGPSDDLPRWTFRPLLPAAMLLAAVWFYGHFRIEMNEPAPGPKIALIQGSIDVEMRYDESLRPRVFDEYYNLSREAAVKNPGLDLIVWPETMFLDSLWTFDADAVRPPWIEGTDAEFHEQIQEIAKQDRENTSLMARMARSLGAPLLLGVDTNHCRAKGVESLNSAEYVARDGRLLARYDKMHLVMFGEYVPFAKEFPWLQGLTPLPFSATPGKRPVAIDVAGVRVAPNICYESVLSHFIRGQVNRLATEGQEPDILINLTNDGWFWGSSELDMHLICGVFRAVECRKPFLIAANTGFSAWIDSDGRIVRQGPRRAKDVILAQPALERGRRSWYLAQGDWFSGGCLVACGIFGLAGLYFARREKRRSCL